MVCYGITGGFGQYPSKPKSIIAGKSKYSSPNVIRFENNLKYGLPKTSHYVYEDSIGGKKISYNVIEQKWSNGSLMQTRTLVDYPNEKNPVVFYIDAKGTKYVGAEDKFNGIESADGKTTAIDWNRDGTVQSDELIDNN
jgi:hypothetical protein